jgi:hypothetical protein
MGNVEVSGGDSGVVDVLRRESRRGEGEDEEDNAANTQATNSAKRLASTEHYEPM